MQHMTNGTRDRIRNHSSPVVNARIDRQTKAQVDEYRAATPEDIGRRLADLDREWDIDRAVMANLAVVGGYFLSRGIRQRSWLRKSNPWLYAISTQLGFLALHATVGWCPPVAVFRRLGFRTHQEIAAERHALRNLLAERHGAASRQRS